MAAKLTRFRSAMPKSTQTPPEEGSKTYRKQEAAALQRIGERLMQLSAEQLQQMDLPNELLEAVLEGQRTKTNAAIVRQRQYIGKVMRAIDAEAINAKLRELDIARGRQAARHSELERWRERLLADDSALTEWMTEHPGSDVARLRALIRGARKEQAENAPPRNSRELFRVLREAMPAVDSTERDT
jgi:ribosome-associated protein